MGLKIKKKSEEVIFIMEKRIYNGIPWYDQNGNEVNAHGACIIENDGKYYLYGEYKTNDKNKYIGFSCYSTENFTDWKFERMALPQLDSGRLGPDRIGERPKVLKNKKTGKFVMLMHTDNMKYTDPCIGLAVTDAADAEFHYQGELFYQGEPIRLWDMGTFIDEDDTAYLLTHEGNIYRLNEEYTEAEELVAESIAPGGESPAMFKKNGIYYLMFSNKTSWERNDNYYFTASNIKGPWTYKGLFCPEGSLTFNTQCSFVFEYDNEKGKIPVYLGDRWSFPRQGLSATLVLLPIEVNGDTMKITEYRQIWNPDTLSNLPIELQNSLDFCSAEKGKSISVDFHGKRIALFGITTKHGGYGEIEILDSNGVSCHKGCVDFYSLVKNQGLQYLSPELKEGSYVLKLTVAGEGGVWYSKNGTRYGSDSCDVHIIGWSCL